MEQEHLHFIANLITGISFWGVSYFFSNFINVLRLKSSKMEEDIWFSIRKFSGVYGLIAAVFWFCGFGHVLEAFRPWVDDFGQMIVIHCCTAVLGLMLTSSLIYYTFLNRK